MFAWQPGLPSYYHVIYHCYLPGYIIIEPLTVVSAIVNLINRREVGFSAKMFELGIDIYLFD